MMPEAKLEKPKKETIKKETGGDTSITMTFSPDMMHSVQESIVTLLRCNPEIIHDALKEVFGKQEVNIPSLEPAETEVLELREVSDIDAERLIKEYVLAHRGCRTSEIIENLELDPLLVVKTLNKLESEKELVSKLVE